MLNYLNLKIDDFRTSLMRKLANHLKCYTYALFFLFGVLSIYGIKYGARWLEQVMLLLFILVSLVSSSCYYKKSKKSQKMEERLAR